MVSISVVIPNYNRDKLLLRAVSSVVEQSIKPDEIIIVDDNSTEQYKSIYRSNVIKYNCKIIYNNENKGGAHSRNIGVNNATSMYVAFLDSDDYWHKEKLSKVKKVLSKNEYDLVYSHQFKVTRTNEIIPNNKKLITDKLWEALLKGWTAPNTSTLVINRNFFLRIGGFDDRLSSCQDHDLWMNLSRSNASVYAIRERLSFFTNSTPDRICFNRLNRINGAKFFLKKWKNTIIKSEGRLHYLWFYNDYIYKVAFPIFAERLKQKRTLKAFLLYARYLIFNYLFYLTIFKKVLGK
jgi:glycosyltransferase involved in cell wall biosynthesis